MRKKSAMDPSYFFDKFANERRHEISRELAVRHLLERGPRGDARGVGLRRLVLLGAPAIVIVIAALVLQFV
jgi:hypothetical protein